ncbi:cytochrome c-type biogenesis protein CcmH/NrfF [Paraburkholderia fungorum]|uniref:hypothetical protein n=1 Tax=Paraburkholderia fungorum TaxID=134537 RepID=UPI00161AEB67|nr:hypothetical protein [Paraburkholderia fungorum]MBB4518151.1 cytochrome c-type biogenesis protein CcmH/NrfF [Paraburkholderia fungorum]
MKKTLAPYWKVVGSGIGAFGAIWKAKHPPGDVSGWMLWTLAVLAVVLFVMTLFEKLPIFTGAVCRARKRDATND